MNGELTLICEYKGKAANIVLTWQNTPFMCNVRYAGDATTLGAYFNALETMSGYFIKPRSSFNVEAHLNALDTAKARFKGFKYTIPPSFDLGDYLRPADKDPEKVY